MLAPFPRSNVDGETAREAKKTNMLTTLSLGEGGLRRAQQKCNLSLLTGGSLLLWSGSGQTSDDVRNNTRWNGHGFSSRRADDDIGYVVSNAHSGRSRETLSVGFTSFLFSSSCMRWSTGGHGRNVDGMRVCIFSGSTLLRLGVKFSIICPLLLSPDQALG